VFDIDGVVRDVGGSYRRALADTVEHYTAGRYRPSQAEIDALKAEGVWNNDWEASRELVYRYAEAQGQDRTTLSIAYDELVAFFQSRYRGSDPSHWTGYICQEPLLMSLDYLNQLTAAGIQWGFFSGATTGSARYVLEYRLGLQTPVLVAMEDAPGKPDPTGLLETLRRLEGRSDTKTPVLYVGDTVADIYTVTHARELQPDRRWFAVGVLPPHVWEPNAAQTVYIDTLRQAGAQIVLRQVEELTPTRIQNLLV
jgi:HAD superfamily phosphatase